MKILMPTGIILECDNDEINETRLKAGGVEVVESAPKKSTKKSESAE